MGKFGRGGIAPGGIPAGGIPPGGIAGRGMPDVGSLPGIITLPILLAGGAFIAFAGIFGMFTPGADKGGMGIIPMGDTGPPTGM